MAGKTRFFNFLSVAPKGVWLVLAVLLMPVRGFALGQPGYVESTATAGSFRLAQGAEAAPILVDAGDYAGVLRAARDLQADIERVSGAKARLLDGGNARGGAVVLIGTIGKSRVIDELVRKKKIDATEVQGKWEATLIQVVEHPLPGVTRALVIAGSDKRGTIYGIYDLSEQIGVSPWYWWADVAVEHRDALFVKAGRWVQGEPAVKYRGIFLNDEAPALSGWAKEKFGGLNHEFYEHVFELLLRLKANYLWPAMWDNAFNEDDPLNPKLADEYGIVMGTSHHEPLLRAQQEWKRHGSGAWDYSTNAKVLKEFWEQGIERNKDYESAVTLGMRGDGDMPMAETDNIALLEKIVADQREILARHQTPTLDADLKVWALYKEVQGYYEKGMRVPDDVTLLWSDDNWGNIRRLPTAQERLRSGGAGVYYHFDYVGDPRSYKWLNTNPIQKVWEQMNLAEAYGANRLWIVNVGDLKPMEFPIEFFLTMARNPELWGKDRLQAYTEAWASREFGPEHAVEIADLISKYTKYNGRRKPEQLEPKTYSLTHYREAERVSAEWKELAERAERVNRELPAEKQASFFELVLHPVKASAIVNELYVAVGQNQLYARQGRATANDKAAEARALFAADAALTDEYNHKLLNGKWNHMMDQTHIGYTFWNEPPLNAMPAVTEVQPEHAPRMGVAGEGASFQVEGGFPMRLPDFDVFNQQSYSFDVFNRGMGAFEFTASTEQPWIKLSETHGRVTGQERVTVSIDWAKVSEGEETGVVSVAQEDGATMRVRIRALRPKEPTRDNLQGFVESNHLVSIEAEHFTSRTEAGGGHWEKLPGYGETLSGMTIFPVTAQSVETAQQAAATLEYKMYLFEGGSYNVQAILAPTLNFVPGRGLRFAVSFDDQTPLVVDALALNTQQDWAQAVSDGVRKAAAKLDVGQPGYHTLKFRMVDPGIVLEKLVVSHDAVPESYLGPPESYRGTTN